MIGELNIAGVFISPLLACLLTAFIARILISHGLDALGLYRYVWRRPLFDIALFFTLAGVSFLLLRALTTP